VGLLACALGWRDDERIATLAHQLRIGVRCDRSPTTLLEDYHTVGGGYRTPMLLTAEGKRKISNKRPHTEQTWRWYLCDASFLVAVQSEPDDTELIERLAAAVQSPAWPIYLGRKSCVPTRPVFAGLGRHDSLRAALQAVDLPARAPDDVGQRRVRAVLECNPEETDSVRRRDQLTSRRFRLWATRYSHDVSLTIRVSPAESEEADDLPQSVDA
jgi:CRISPR system Cascade subunit CasD